MSATEECKEVKQRHALIRRRLNKLLRQQTHGPFMDRSQLNPLQRAQYGEGTVRVASATSRSYWASDPI
jgi:hypothetical protein